MKNSEPGAQGSLIFLRLGIGAPLNHLEKYLYIYVDHADGFRNIMSNMFQYDVAISLVFLNGYVMPRSRRSGIVAAHDSQNTRFGIFLVAHKVMQDAGARILAAIPKL
jgi:hypothetical protein